jgi:hypothetical protein
MHKKTKDFQAIVSLMLTGTQLLTRDQCENLVWGRSRDSVDPSKVLRKCISAGVAQELKVNFVPEFDVGRIAVGNSPEIDIQAVATKIALRSKELQDRIASPGRVIEAGNLLCALLGRRKPNASNPKVLQAHLRMTEVYTRYVVAGGHQNRWHARRYEAPLGRWFAVAKLRKPEQRKTTLVLCPVNMKLGEAKKALNQAVRVAEHIEVWM